MALDSSSSCDGVHLGMQDRDGMHGCYHSPNVLSGSEAVGETKCGADMVRNHRWRTAVGSGAL